MMRLVFAVLAANVDINKSLLNLCDWVTGLGVGLGTVALTGVGIMFIMSFDNHQQSAQARRALVMVVFGMIILYAAAGLAAVVKSKIAGL
jgi:hypothetical protein